MINQASVRDDEGDLMNTIDIIIVVILFLVMIVATFTDLKHRLIPNWLTITAIGIMSVIRIFHHPHEWSYVLGLIPAILMFLIALFISEQAFGGGDILLSVFIGITLGLFGTILTLIWSFFAMSLCFIILKLLTGTKYKVLPMAPFLLLGLIIFMLQPYWLLPILQVII